MTWRQLASLLKLTAAPMQQLLARAEYDVERPTLAESVNELRSAATAAAAAGADGVAEVLLAALGSSAGAFEA